MQNGPLVFINDMPYIKGHFMVFYLDGFQFIAMIVGLNWLLVGSNTYHKYFIQGLMP